VAAVGRIFLDREGAAEDDGRAEEAEVRFGNVTTVKIAVLAPMPRAIAAMAVRVKAGLATSMRRE
jgi:hypothetical protein